eukprot:GILI01008307.1.p1 GENE.GILI01008307.1~~GILI01008307.1.p1  ORF type:complete len:896 (+),score=189.93 GILI01008307.1:183-2870(+)
MSSSKPDPQKTSREWIIKVLEVILQSRIQWDDPTKPRNSIAFQLEYEEKANVRDYFAAIFQRLDESHQFLIQFYQEVGPTKHVLERWVLRYDVVSDQGHMADRSMYKKASILLRSLYLLLTNLPAYIIVRTHKNKRTRPFSSSPSVSSSRIQCEVKADQDAAKYFAQGTPELRESYSFSHLDGHNCRFSLSVAYRKDIPMEPREISGQSVRHSEMVIQEDYVPASSPSPSPSLTPTLFSSSSATFAVPAPPAHISSGPHTGGARIRSFSSVEKPPSGSSISPSPSFNNLAFSSSPPQSSSSPVPPAGAGFVMPPRRPSPTSTSSFLPATSLSPSSVTDSGPFFSSTPPQSTSGFYNSNNNAVNSAVNYNVNYNVNVNNASAAVARARSQSSAPAFSSNPPPHPSAFILSRDTLASESHEGQSHHSTPSSNSNATSPFVPPSASSFVSSSPSSVGVVGSGVAHGHPALFPRSGSVLSSSPLALGNFLVEEEENARRRASSSDEQFTAGADTARSKSSISSSAASSPREHSKFSSSPVLFQAPFAAWLTSSSPPSSSAGSPSLLSALSSSPPYATNPPHLLPFSSRKNSAETFNALASSSPSPASSPALAPSSKAPNSIPSSTPSTSAAPIKPVIPPFRENNRSPFVSSASPSSSVTSSSASSRPISRCNSSNALTSSPAGMVISPLTLASLPPHSLLALANSVNLSNSGQGGVNASVNGSSTPRGCCCMCGAKNSASSALAVTSRLRSSLPRSGSNNALPVLAGPSTPPPVQSAHLLSSASSLRSVTELSAFAPYSQPDELDVVNSFLSFCESAPPLTLPASAHHSQVSFEHEISRLRKGKEKFTAALSNLTSSSASISSPPARPLSSPASNTASFSAASTPDVQKASPRLLSSPR